MWDQETLGVSEDLGRVLNALENKLHVFLGLLLTIKTDITNFLELV